MEHKIKFYIKLQENFKISNKLEQTYGTGHFWMASRVWKMNRKINKSEDVDQI